MAAECLPGTGDVGHAGVLESENRRLQDRLREGLAGRAAQVELDDLALRDTRLLQRRSLRDDERWVAV